MELYSARQQETEKTEQKSHQVHAYKRNADGFKSLFKL